MPADTDQLHDLLALIRPEVRALRAYRVETELDDAVKLDQNESPFDLPDEIKRAAADAFVQSGWNRYPPDRPHALTRALAEHLGWPAEGILIGRGSNELTHTIGIALIGEGRPVVLPYPMFALHENVARLYGGRVVSVAPQPDLSHDPDDVIAAMRESEAALTIVCTPNNPTGLAFSFEDLERMAEAAPGFFLIDEAYVEFVEGPTAMELVRRHPHVILMRTFSKAMGLAGLRLGYLVAHPEVAAELDKPRLPFLVDRFSEAVGLAMLERQDLVRERARALASERERVLAALGGRPDVEVVRGAANFFIMRTPLPAADLLAALRAEGVRLRDVSGYRGLSGGGPGRFPTGWVRVSIGTPAENSTFLDALNRVLMPAVR